MAFIKWGKEHLTKHKQMDKEHKAIVDLLNEMYERLVEKKEVKKLLYSLHKTVTEHFDHEKKLMLDSEYKSFYSHDQEHKRYLNKMNLFVDAIKRKEEVISISYLESCRDWFANHLELKDRKLANHLIENKIK